MKRDPYRNVVMVTTTRLVAKPACTARNGNCTTANKRMPSMKKPRNRVQNPARRNPDEGTNRSGNEGRGAGFEYTLAVGDPHEAQNGWPATSSVPQVGQVAISISPSFSDNDRCARSVP